MNRGLPWLALGLLAVALAAPASEAPVADALRRPALTVSAPTRAVLIDVTRAGERLVAVGEQGLILLSDDNGRSWRQAPSPTSVSLTAVDFPTAQQGWAVGHAGVVLHSNDGGASWAVQLDGQAVAERELQAASAANDDSPAAQRRLKAARALVAEGADKPWLALYFANAREGTLVGAFGLVLHTENGGATWQSWMGRLDNPAGNHLYAITGQGQQLYIAGEQGTLWGSDDGGAHLRRLPSPYEGSFFSAALEPDGTLLAAGLKGNAWRSRDQGQHWQALGNDYASSIVAARPAWNDGVMLLDQGGRLLQANEQGALRPQGRPLGNLPAALAQAADGRWVAVGARGIERVEQVTAP
ncbi:YCF48-related protein [Pseudomonas entomophila]|uniref:WD40/YVTN/BNR-like repeat-containing protein n=1 Tax=Pseudomonas entomophila TaxID=312306 RepID=UPI0023D84FA5|nr:YCF48-related protein [Pseudomonas entomophila]MDF0730706.1 YCF48-related protein [Pseudomonas entomophila]